MANSVILCLIISSKIIHFGINPDIGGRPPSDSKIIIINEVSEMFLAHEVAILLILVEDMLIIIKNNADVINIYTSRVSIVRWVEYGRIIIIHPRCAVDE